HLVAHAPRRHPCRADGAEHTQVERRPRGVGRRRHAGRDPRLPTARRRRPGHRGPRADDARVLRRARAARDARAPVARGGTVGRLRALGAGIAGGLLAGAIVGAAEAIGVWLHAHGTGELPPIGWALIAYGLVGGAFGFGAGVLAALVGADGFGLAFAGVGAT